jgi:hypothetical protein
VTSSVHPAELDVLIRGYFATTPTDFVDEDEKRKVFELGPSWRKADYRVLIVVYGGRHGEF